MNFLDWKERTDELERLAKAAQADKPGASWAYDEEGGSVKVEHPTIAYGWIGCSGGGCWCGMDNVDARYVAACSPDKILELIAFMRDLESMVPGPESQGWSS